MVRLSALLGHLAESKQLLATASALQAEHAEIAAKLERDELRTASERQAVADEMAELSATKEALFALNNQAQLNAQRAEHLLEEGSGLNERVQDARREIDTLTQRVGENAQQEKAVEVEIDAFKGDAETRQAAFEEKQQAHELLKTELRGAREALDVATRGVSEGMAQTARLESEIEGARGREVDLGQRLGSFERGGGRASGGGGSGSFGVG